MPESSSRWYALAGLGAFIWLLYALAPVLTPFLCSALLAYLGDPWVDRLERAGLGRSVSVTCVFLLMLLIGIGGLLVILPAIQRQIAVVLARIPDLLTALETRILPFLSARFGVVLELDVAALRESMTGHWQQLGEVVRSLAGHLGRSGQWLLGWISFLFLVPVVTFYLLRDWDALVPRALRLVPRRHEAQVRCVVGEIDAVLAQFLRGQLAVMAVLALVYVGGLWLTGLDLAFAIGVLAGLVSFVPYLGVILGLLLAGLAALLQFGDTWHLLAVAGVFGFGQVLEGVVLSPLLVGERIGLHPVAVIFAVMAGGQLFGFAGVLLALPVAAAVVVLLRHWHADYLDSQFYDPKPPEK